MDIESLAAPLSDEAPSGEDLEYDPEMGELQRKAEGTPAQELGEGKIDAVPPDWRSVRDKSLALLERTRDLRVAVLLANSLVALDGFSGLRDGLQLLGGMSENLWDTVHPQLDEDDQDPFVRCNAIRELTNRERMLTNVLDAPFVAAPQAGNYSLRDLKLISGELKLPEGSERQLPTAGLLEAAFQEVGAEALEANHAVIVECAELLRSLDALFSEKVGVGDSPDLTGLQSYLDEIEQQMRQEMSRIGIGNIPVDEAQEADDTPGGSSGAAISGDVRNSADVLRMIDKMCLYYQQHEPSSPVPILLRRAASLVNKSFMDIVSDLAPSGVSELQMFGPGEDSDG